jgi:hypothetical protein
MSRIAGPGGVLVWRRRKEKRRKREEGEEDEGHRLMEGEQKRFLLSRCRGPTHHFAGESAVVDVLSVCREDES